MQISHLILGDYENNCYVVHSKNSANCLIIDTGIDSMPLLSFLRKNSLNPFGVILTHGHGDHIAGVETLRKNYHRLKVYIHKADAEMLTSAIKNLSAMLGKNLHGSPADVIIEKEGTFDFDGLTFEIIHTPGHTPGGICLYSAADKIIFTGDSLFAGSVGRTDFPGYDVHACMQQLIENIRKKLLILPGETKILPGHGPFSTIEQEKSHNPHLQ